MAFTKSERRLVGMAAGIVFARVFAFSLTLLGFTEYARTLAVGLDPIWTDRLAGVALGAYGLTMAVAQLGSGWLSDRVGRRPVLVGGAVLFLLGAVASALATNLILLIGARLLMGLGGVSSVAMAAVGETVPNERRTTAMALIGIPAGVGVFLGFAVGPILASAWGFGAVLWGTVILAVLAFLPVLQRLPEPLPGLDQPHKSLSRPVLGLGLAGFSINYAMTAVMYDFQSEVLARIGHVALGLILLAAFLVMGIASRRVDKGFGPRIALAAALALLVVAAPVFRLSTASPWILVGGVAFFAAHATLSAVIPSQVSRLAGRSGGKGHGFQLVIAYLGSSAGGIAAGALTGHMAGAFWLLLLAALAAGVLIWTGMPQVSSGSPTAKAHEQ